MIIRDIQVGEIALPLARPFKTALRTVEHVDDIVVRVVADTGEMGYGEGAPHRRHHRRHQGLHCLCHPGVHPSQPHRHGCRGSGWHYETPPWLYPEKHLRQGGGGYGGLRPVGQALGAPLYKLLGGARSSFRTDITISVNPIDEMVADALDAVSRGYDILKIKVGKEGTADVARIAAIREAVGPGIQLRVDANQGWTPKQSVSIISAMEDRNLDIELVEQPVKAHDIAGMEFVTSRVNTPILADESVFSPEDAIQLIQRRAADLINIKLMKTGGIHQALKICDIAELYGVECMIGCMLESKLSVSAAAHLCCGRSVITKADLDGPSLCSVDPFEGGPRFDEALVSMTDLPGVGLSAIPCQHWS